MKRYFIKWFNFFVKQTPEVLSPNVQKSYKTIKSFLNKIPDINYGGCGISTLVLFDHAKAEGLNPKIIFGYSRWSGGYEENNEYRKGNRKHAESASHIFINIEGVDFDSNGVYERDDDWVFDSEITREHLVNAIVYGSWNDRFNRKKWLPEIEKFIGYKLV